MYRAKAHTMPGTRSLTSTKAEQMVEGRRGWATLAVDCTGRLGPSRSVSESKNKARLAQCRTLKIKLVTLSVGI